MILDKQENILIITQESADTIELVKKIDARYNEVQNDNIIVNLFSFGNLTKSDLVEFLQLSKKHRVSKHSFVIVTNKISTDDLPEAIMTVPTLQEAFDIIEMEEIERDLGF
ncbi:ribonuclease Z [Kordia sp.]|uniref:ribonuclease Z n=1 Tax=Kordia sp. TaxID=1965332 RepID=UPI003D6A5717